MELDAPSQYSQRQDKLVFANQFTNLILDLFHFYSNNRFFFIPNDLIEAVATLLGYYVADSYLFDSIDFQQGMTTIKHNISANADKGFELAGFYKEYQENIVFELKQQQIYTQNELNTALFILDINLQLGKLLMVSNKKPAIQQPTEEIESRVNNFIRQQFYPALQGTDQQAILATNDKTTFIINELSTYLGWLAGFYAKLLESTATLFATYTFICLETAANQKSKH